MKNLKLNINFFVASLVSLSLLLIFPSCNKESQLKSPDGKIAVVCSLNENKEAVYSITSANEAVILPSKLGIIMNDADFSKDLKFVGVSKIMSISNSYQMIQGKRKDCQYIGNEQTFGFENSFGEKMEVIFRVSNDGVAFRYYFPTKSEEVKQITEELTSFTFSPTARAWMQPMSVAKSGWCRSNPSYEEYYSQNIEAGTPSPLGKGWIFPALLKSNDNWILISETGLTGSYCGSRLIVKPNATYQIGFPEEVENFPGGGTLPQSTLPWYTPWRVLAIGSLKTVTESTLETDLANPAVAGDYSWVKPGKSSWSWVLLKDDSTVFDVQKKYIDYAADMNWDYCLIDALWDKQIGYEKLGKLVKYASAKNIGVLVWYNSSGDWNDTPQTPKSKLLTHEQRLSEFGRLKTMGIKGVKVDFFGGDGQSMIQYYLDLIKDAADQQLLINFHGCTYPRSWHRTYPNLVTMESIKGMEFITFEQRNADNEPTHGAMLNYTRNAFSPMDFTPMCLHSIPNIDRKTTNVYELATSVLFLSGIQHYAERPEGIASIPIEIKEILKHIPSVWDESVFVDGFPGKLTVMARRSGNTWYVAGINGEPVDKNLNLDLSFIKTGKALLITEGADKYSYKPENLTLDMSKKLAITINGNGGFFMKFEN
jgi:alpha-glucosidase